MLRVGEMPDDARYDLYLPFPCLSYLKVAEASSPLCINLSLSV